ncbi:MAG: High potential iron-sulfur protein [Pseudomonadota bacterium]
MNQQKTRRDAIKLSLGVLVGLPAITALNACTQCSKPADSGAATEAPQSGADAAATPAGDSSGMAASTPATEAAPAQSPAAEQSTAAAGGETLTLISETEPTAAALNYKHDASAVPANLQVAKNGVPFAEQRCAGCSFYKAAGQIDGAEVGTCQVLAAGKVKSTGWCNSWGKKA